MCMCLCVCTCIPACPPIYPFLRPHLRLLHMCPSLTCRRCLHVRVRPCPCPPARHLLQQQLRLNLGLRSMWVGEWVSGRAGRGHASRFPVRAVDSGQSRGRNSTAQPGGRGAPHTHACTPAWLSDAGPQWHEPHRTCCASRESCSAVSCACILEQGRE